MNTLAFAVYDLKALCYGVPFFMPNVGSAVRAFSDVANDTQSAISRHPSDYVLFQVGEFDDNKGTLNPIVPLISLGLASDFVKRVPMVSELSRVSRAVSDPLATEAELNGGK